MTNEPDANVSIFDLSLETVPRTKIAIEGFGTFELAEPDDYSVPVVRAINRMWGQITDSLTKETMTEKEGKEYEKNLDALLRYACPNLPKEVLEHPNFKRTIKSGIVSAFFIESMKKEMPLKRRGDLDTPSADFAASMAEALETT